MARRRSKEAVANRDPVDEVLPAGSMFVYGLQHVMSMYAGVVAVPLIVGGAMGTGVPRARLPPDGSAARLWVGDAAPDPRGLADRRPAADRPGHLGSRPSPPCVSILVPDHFESGISAAAVTAVLLNILFNVIGQGRDETPTIFADAPPPGVTPSHDVPGGVDAGVRRDATPPIAADPPPPGVTPSHDVPGGVDSGATETRRERRQPPEH